MIGGGGGGGFSYSTDGLLNAGPNFLYVWVLFWFLYILLRDVSKNLKFL